MDAFELFFHVLLNKQNLLQDQLLIKTNATKLLPLRLPRTDRHSGTNEKISVMSECVRVKFQFCGYLLILH